MLGSLLYRLKLCRDNPTREMQFNLTETPSNRTPYFILYSNLNREHDITLSPENTTHVWPWPTSCKMLTWFSQWVGCVITWPNRIIRWCTVKFLVDIWRSYINPSIIVIAADSANQLGSQVITANARHRLLYVTLLTHGAPFTNTVQL